MLFVRKRHFSFKLEVDFDADGGTASKSKIIIELGQPIGTLPTATKEGYSFAGWYDGETRITASTVPTDDMTVKARWTDVPQYTLITVPGGGYLNTGIVADNDTVVEWKVDVQSKAEYWLGAWKYAYNNGSYNVGNDGWGSTSDGIFTAYGGNGGTRGSAVSNGIHTMKFDHGVLTVDGGTFETRSYSSSFTTQYPLYLFAQNRSGSTVGVPGVGQTVKMYWCKIWQGDELVRSFVPYVEDGTAGMKDLVSNTFYSITNDQGSVVE